MLSIGPWRRSVADRLTLDVASPAGGWGPPWPNVAEIEAVLPHDKWTLVGGLMTQLHGISRGVDTLRPTNDVDIVLHVETMRGVAREAALALEALGYRLARPSTSGTTLLTGSGEVRSRLTSWPIRRTSSTCWSPTTPRRGWRRS